MSRPVRLPMVGSILSYASDSSFDTLVMRPHQRLRFRSQIEKHELSHLYEAKIRNMGNAGRNGGEYYTPSLLIRAIAQVGKSKLGERI